MTYEDLKKRAQNTKGKRMLRPEEEKKLEASPLPPRARMLTLHEQGCWYGCRRGRLLADNGVAMNVGEVFGHQPLAKTVRKKTLAEQNKTMKVAEEEGENIAIA